MSVATKVPKELLQKLRAATGAAMKDCKSALLKHDLDPRKAAAEIRETGLNRAHKLSGRDALQGSIAVSKSPKKISLVEVRAETDFVSKNALYLYWTARIADTVAHSELPDTKLCTEADEVLNMKLANPSPQTIRLGEKLGADACTDTEGIETARNAIELLVSRIRENIKVHRWTVMSPRAPAGCALALGAHLHNTDASPMHSRHVSASALGAWTPLCMNLELTGDQQEGVGRLANQVASHLIATSEEGWTNNVEDQKFCHDGPPISMWLGREAEAMGMGQGKLSVLDVFSSKVGDDFDPLA